MQAPQNDERFNCQHDTTRKEFLLQLWGGKDHVSACPETREQQEIKSSRTGRFAHVYPFESRSFWTTPPPPSINGGYLYSMIVACRSTRYKWCQGLKQKSDVHTEIRKALADASRFKPEGVSFEITTDSDPLFGMRCSAWQEVLREFKAVHIAVGARRQWMNSGGERSIRTLSESSKALRHAAGLDDSFWLLSQQCACHVDRFLPRAALGWESPQTVTGRPQAKIECFVPFGCMGAYKTPPENADGCRGKLGMVVGTCTATDYATIMLTRTEAGNSSFMKTHRVTFDQSSPAAMQLGDDSGEACVPPREQWDRILTDESVVPGHASANLRSGQPDRTFRVHGCNTPGESALVVPTTGQPAGQVAVPVHAAPADAEGDVLDLDAIGNSQTNAPDDINLDIAPVAANQTAQANPISTTSAPFRMNLRSRASKAVNVLETLGSDTSSSHIMVSTEEKRSAIGHLAIERQRRNTFVCLETQTSAITKEWTGYDSRIKCYD